MSPSFLTTQKCVKVKIGFYLRDEFIPPKRLGKILDTVDDGKIILVDFGTPDWTICRFKINNLFLIEFVELEEIIKEERKKQYWNMWKRRVRKFLGFFHLIKKHHIYDG